MAGPARLAAAALLALTIAPAAAEETARPGTSFTIESFFSGETFGRGFVKPLIGARQDFTSAFAGRQEGDAFVVEERFAFEDGKRPVQRWRFRRVATDRYEGAVDFGESTVTARLKPDGVVIDYDGRGPGGHSPVFHFRHEMTRNADGTVTNRVAVSKAGLTIARSLVRFAKSRDLLRAAPSD